MFVLIKVCQKIQERKRVGWWEEGNQGREEKGRGGEGKLNTERKKRKKIKKKKRKAKGKKRKRRICSLNFLL